MYLEGPQWHMDVEKGGRASLFCDMMGNTRILNSVFSLHDLVILGIVESYANLPSYRAASLCRL